MTENRLLDTGDYLSGIGFSRSRRSSRRKSRRIGFLGATDLSNSIRLGSRRFDRGCANLVTSRAKTSSLSIDGRKEKLSDFLTSQPN